MYLKSFYVNTMGKYRKVIPLVIRNLIIGLGDKKRQEIVAYLLTEGEKPFYTVCKDLKLNPDELHEYAMTLLRYGLIYNRYCANDFDDKYLLYSITKLARKFIKNVTDMVKPYIDG